MGSILAAALILWPLLPAATQAQSAASNAGAGAPATSFSDLSAYPWAQPAVQAMAAIGVLDGTSPGIFDPSGTTTRAEMAVVLTRLAGWQAPTSTGSPTGAGATPRLPFTDASTIPSWAAPDVALVAARGIMEGEADGGFHPNDPVTWEQLAAIAARTFADRVAVGQVVPILSQLPQGSATPAWAVQDVARGVLAGYFQGLLAALYQPGQPVSRAELALFLLQVASTSGANPQLLSGTVTSVAGGGLTVVGPNGPESFTLAPGAPVYAGTNPADASAIQPGDTATVVQESGAVAWVQVTAQAPGEVVAGTVTAVAPPTLSLALSGGAVAVLTLAAGATVSINGQSSQPSGLVVGDPVSVRLDASGDAVAVNASSAVTPSPTAPSTTPTTPPASAGTVASYTLSPNPIASSGSLAAGAQVTVTLSALNSVGSPVAGSVVYLSIQAAAAPGGGTASVGGTPLSGTPAPFTTNSGGQLAITYTTPGVLPSGGTDSISAANAANDGTVVTLDDYTYAAAQATTVVPNSTFQGTIQSLQGLQALTLTPAGGQTTTLPFALDATVTSAGQTLGLTALAAGQTVTVTVNSANQVMAVVIDSGAGTGSTSGYVVGVNASVPSVAFYETSGPTPNAVSSDTLVAGAAVTVDGQTATLNALPIGDAVTLTLNSAGQAVAATALTPSLPAQVVRGTLSYVGSGTLTGAGSNTEVTVNESGSQVPIGVGQDAVGVDNSAIVPVTSLPTGTAVTVVTNVAPFGSGLVIVSSNPSGSLAITTSSLPNATAGYSYSQTLSAIGGAGGYVWTYSGGLPPGMNLNSGGVVSGTPTNSGTYPFVATVRDSVGDSAEVSLAITVNVANSGSGPVVTTTSLPVATVGQSYYTTLSAINGSGNYIWTYSGTPPPGLNIGTNGVVGGTPTEGGTFTFTVQARDTQTGTQSNPQQISIVVDN